MHCWGGSKGGRRGREHLPAPTHLQAQGTRGKLREEGPQVQETATPQGQAPQAKAGKVGSRPGRQPTPAPTPPETGPGLSRQRAVSRHGWAPHRPTPGDQAAPARAEPGCAGMRHPRAEVQGLTAQGTRGQPTLSPALGLWAHGLHPHGTAVLSHTCVRPSGSLSQASQEDRDVA